MKFSKWTVIWWRDLLSTFLTISGKWKPSHTCTLTLKGSSNKDNFLCYFLEWIDLMLHFISFPAMHTPLLHKLYFPPVCSNSPSKNSPLVKKSTPKILQISRNWEEGFQSRLPYGLNPVYYHSIKPNIKIV